MQSLTLNGNPIEEIKGYRLYVLGIMFDLSEKPQGFPQSQLKKLDSVIISNNEFDNVIVWNERLFAGMKQRLRRLRPNDPKKPPAKEEDETKPGATTGS